MIDLESVERHLRGFLRGVPSAGPNAIEIPEPGGVAGLAVLGERLTLRHDHREGVKMPGRTLKDGGGDWDDVTLLLMAAAGPKGIKTRLQFNGRTLCLQARKRAPGAGSERLAEQLEEWTTIGPHAPVAAGAQGSEGTDD